MIDNITSFLFSCCTCSACPICFDDMMISDAEQVSQTIYRFNQYEQNDVETEDIKKISKSDRKSLNHIKDRLRSKNNLY